MKSIPRKKLEQEEMYLDCTLVSCLWSHAVMALTKSDMEVVHARPKILNLTKRYFSV